MRVRVVCRADQADWILGKIARRLAAELAGSLEASVAAEPDPSADVNHFVWYDDFRETAGAATIGITHIDSMGKLEKVRAQLASARVGICLSRHQMADLIHAGLPRERLCYVTPAHDGVISPRKIRIGIATRLYTPDPCKREWMLEDLAGCIDPEDFAFCIVGSGWESIVDGLRRRRFEVTHDPVFDLPRYRALVPTFDYYLYLGWDEGSMGLLDALQAGVKTIATAQGFHLDIPGGLTHAIDSQASLVGVFREIAGERRQRTNAVRDLTWARYAEQHRAIWDYVVSGRRAVDGQGRGDGLASLLSTDPARDAVRGRAVLAELEETDRIRVERERAYRAR